MLLLIDAGNTLIKWAIVKSGVPFSGSPSWLYSGKNAHEEMPDFPDILKKNQEKSAIRHVLISSVANEKTNQKISQIIDELRPKPIVVWFSSDASLAGVTNTYTKSHQLGCDRFASLIGARAIFPDENLVVVTCGTATTIDTLTSDGIFIGGMILPGLRLMANSLFGNTAKLPDIGQMTENIPAFATDTINAIRNGCMTAQAGAIEHAVNVHAHHLNSVRCVLSGGASSLIKPYLSIPVQIVDNLVLIGLHTAYTAHYAKNLLC